MSSHLEIDAPFEATILGLLRRQFTKPKPLPATIRLTGETAIITGSNVGLGFEACRQLLSRGLSQLIMGVRSQVKGEAAANRLRQEFPNTSISVWIVDMESYDSIQTFANQCHTLERIDIVVLNAGLMKTSYMTAAATGHEVMMQVNYLSTALLAILVLPILKSKKTIGANRPPVLSIVGSDLAYTAKLERQGPVLRQFDTSRDFSHFEWYGKSKLMLIFFIARLAEMVSPSDVLINMSNPGATKGTDFGRDTNLIFRKAFSVLQFFLSRTVAEGASMYLDAALTRGTDSHGSFISEWTIKPYPKIWYTPEGRETDLILWEETLGELDFAGARQILKDMRGNAS
ncbi:hypothetical protein E0Z10_g3194 [Xylaria hypoxylon]|uniref:Ketoreductase (KR) domain-containing protein n=1 Tax=Xylaria hypoxylon TaxID=37992 RepID=A0A4Z0YNS7_9PEZI|nr:hypothetical protein E0Z10_g3194 [Xylaria hypoxylon]